MANLSGVGGTNLKDILKHCFHAVFKKEVASQFMYQGGANTQKRSFDKMKLKEVIFSAVALQTDELNLERPTQASLKTACQTFFNNVSNARYGRKRALLLKLTNNAAA